MTMKRDNWTNEEVIKLIETERLEDIPDNESDRAYNAALDDAINHFKRYMCPEKDMSALAYDTETGREVHIGGV